MGEGWGEEEDRIKEERKGMKAEKKEERFCMYIVFTSFKVFLKSKALIEYLSKIILHGR